MRAALVVLVGFGMGCGYGAGGGAEPEACVQPLSPSVDAAAMAALDGSYHLTRVATSGPNAGRSATGPLELRANTDSLTRMAGGTTPYYGWADLGDRLGAVIPGAADSRDPQQPGVLVVAGSSGTVMMRMGSTANNRREAPMEGEYLVFRVRDVTTSSIKGSWTSGQQEETASGYFCATRRSD